MNSSDFLKSLICIDTKHCRPSIFGIRDYAYLCVNTKTDYAMSIEVPISPELAKASNTEVETPHGLLTAIAGSYKSKTNNRLFAVISKLEERGKESKYDSTMISLAFISPFDDNDGNTRGGRLLEVSYKNTNKWPVQFTVYSPISTKRKEIYKDITSYIDLKIKVIEILDRREIQNWLIELVMPPELVEQTPKQSVGA